MMPTHRRIRPFNTRDTYPDQKLDNDLCQAVVAGNTVYLRGQVGQDLETAASVGIGDPAAQAEQAMKNIAQLLAEADSRLEEIVKIVIYLTDPRYREPVYQVVGRWLKGVYPVSTGVVVSALARPEWLVEIDVTAVIDETGRRRDGERMTFSIAARCGRTGRFGAAVSSSSPAVAARCAYVRAGVGAACSQNVTDPRLGPRLLDLMGGGISAPMAIASVVAETEQIDFRQLTAVDVAGRVAGYSGERTLGRHRIAEGDGVVAAGNLLADPGVPAAMVAAFVAWPEGDLGDRLVDALIAGLETGGEAGPVHSAGLLLAADVPWPVADLRVDWSDDPIGELARLWQLWKPQLNDYVTRALDPRSAPGYGVPGDP